MSSIIPTLSLFPHISQRPRYVSPRLRAECPSTYLQNRTYAAFPTTCNDETILKAFISLFLSLSCLASLHQHTQKFLGGEKFCLHYGGPFAVSPLFSRTQKVQYVLRAAAANAQRLFISLPHLNLDSIKPWWDVSSPPFVSIARKTIRAT